MGTKLFVGGINWQTTDDGLREAFERFGNVEEAKVIMDRETGRSRGFGFVTFTTEDEAKDAMASMDGTELEGRTIKVNVAEDRRRGPGGPRGPRHGGGGGGFGGPRY